MKIRAVVKLPGMKPAVTRIEDSPEALRRLVGGSLSSVMVSEDIVVVCNAQAKEQGLKKNMKFLGATFYGPVVALSPDGEELAGLSEKNAELVRKLILMR